jgi:hypothetical protein
MLDPLQVDSFKSGLMYGSYLCIIKRIMDGHNQQLNINEGELTQLKRGQGEKNWKLIEKELSKIGLYVE